MSLLARLLFCFRGQHRVDRKRVKYSGDFWIGECSNCGCSLKKDLRSGRWLADDENPHE